jgi:hypothetical protein
MTFLPRKNGNPTFQQPWATQIGSRAKFLLSSHIERQSIQFYYAFGQFFYEMPIFRGLKRAAIERLKGRRLPMVDLQILCCESPEVVLLVWKSTHARQINPILFSRKIVASSWWWYRWGLKCPLFECHHQCLTKEQLWDQSNIPINIYEQK